ncbi:hypothetical protein DICA4_E26764 [Diutina catenulata]
MFPMIRAMSRVRALPRVTPVFRTAPSLVRWNSSVQPPQPPRQEPPVAKKSPQKQNTPRVRYLFYMLVLSWGVLYLVTKKVDRKPPPKSFSSEREFRDYEQQTGLKRRSKLLNHEKNEHYRFYVVPYVSNDQDVEKIGARLKELDPNREVKVIDPAQLIAREKEDESRKYCYLLRDLDARHKSYPKGLVTALVKNEVAYFLNTRMGTFDTNIVLKNYPQTTDEAIKFENEVSSVQKCLVTHYDLVNKLSDPKLARQVNNVVGYFNTVDKVKELVSKHDDVLDRKLKEIMLEDI